MGDIRGRVRPATRTAHAVSAETFYHGTTARLAVGEWLVPGGEIGRDNYGLGENGAVYLTTSLGFARIYALAALRNDPGAEPVVYEVAPDFEIVESSADGTEWETGRAEVLGVVP